MKGVIIWCTCFISWCYILYIEPLSPNLRSGLIFYLDINDLVIEVMITTNLWALINRLLELQSAIPPGLVHAPYQRDELSKAQSVLDIDELLEELGDLLRRS